MALHKVLWRFERKLGGWFIVGGEGTESPPYHKTEMERRKGMLKGKQVEDVKKIRRQCHNLGFFAFVSVFVLFLLLF